MPRTSVDAESPAAAAIQYAATVIVLRNDHRGPQVLLQHRHPRLRFMGDYWAFPGGRLDPGDLDATVVAPALVTEVLSCDVQPVDEPTARGLVAAALRELREEAGILVTPRRLPSMIYWARWITPSGLPRRFDTHFFAVEVGADVPAIPADGESTEARWMAPCEAIAAGECGAMKLAAPTLISLRDLDRALSRSSDLAALFERERGRRVVPVMPKMIDASDDSLTLLPWDPGYDAAPGEGIAVSGLLPPHWREWPSRLP